MNLFGIWKQKEIQILYKIKESEGASYTDYKPQTIIAGDAFKPRSHPKTSLNFTSWNSKKDGTGNTYYAPDKCRDRLWKESNLMYAQYRPNNWWDYTATFLSSAGEGIWNVGVETGQMVMHPIETVKSLGALLEADTYIGLKDSVIADYEKFSKAELKEKVSIAGNLTGEVLLIFVPASKISKLSKVSKLKLNSVLEKAKVIVKTEKGTSSKNVIEKAEKGLQGNGCFVAGTLIPTESGEQPIEDIRAGDHVYSENPETGEKGFKEVANTFIHDKDTLLNVYAGNTKIETTEEHPFWVVGTGWVLAGELKIGATLLLHSGKTVKITKLKLRNLEKPVKVYNFEVEDWHTYYVSESRVLVHNKPMVSGIPGWFSKQIEDLPSELRNQWGKGTQNTLEDSLYYHYKTHASEMGASNLTQYMRKAEGFSQNLKGAKTSKPTGGTPGAIRHTKNGKYIIIGPDGKILSYGKAR